MDPTVFPGDSDKFSTLKMKLRSTCKLDESQVDYYKIITKQMPGRVLKNRGVVSQDSNSYTLNISDLTVGQRSELISLCNNKIEEYAETRGGERKIWLHRMKSPSYVPGTLRYEVLKKAKGLFELKNSFDAIISNIQRQIKDLNKKTDFKRHQIIRDLQVQVRDMQRKIDRIVKSMKSPKSKGATTTVSSNCNIESIFV